jgi:hypothetical protein
MESPLSFSLRFNAFQKYDVYTAPMTKSPPFHRLSPSVGATQTSLPPDLLRIDSLPSPAERPGVIELQLAASALRAEQPAPAHPRHLSLNPSISYAIDVITRETTARRDEFFAQNHSSPTVAAQLDARRRLLQAQFEACAQGLDGEEIRSNVRRLLEHDLPAAQLRAAQAREDRAVGGEQRPPPGPGVLIPPADLARQFAEIGDRRGLNTNGLAQLFG